MKFIGILFLLLGLFFVLPVQVGAQNSEAAKLVQQAQAARESGKINAVQLANWYSKALELSTKSGAWGDYLQAAEAYSDYLLTAEAYVELSQKGMVWISALESANTSASDKWAQLCKNVGISFYILDDYSSSLIFLQKTLNIREKMDATNPDLARDYSNIGQLQRFLGRYTDAIKALERAAELQKNDELLVYIYGEFAIVYNKSGNFTKALEYSELALSLTEQLYGNQSLESAIANMTKGEILSKTSDFEKALAALNRANRIFSRLETRDYENQHVCLQQIGVIFINIYTNNKTETRFLDSALAYHQRAEQLDKFLSPNSPIIFSNTLSYTTALGQKQNFAEQKSNLNRAAIIAKKIFPDKHTSVAILNQAFAEYYNSQNNHKEALKYHQMQIIALCEGYDNIDINSLPTEKDFAKCLSIEGLTDALAGKSRTSYLMFLESKDKKDLDRALITIILYDKLVNFVRQNSPDANNVKWASFTFDGYEKAIEICFAYYKLNKDKKMLNQAFYFSEKSKGLSLLQAFQTTKASKLAGISPELLKEEAQLKLDISELDQELYILTAQKSKDNLQQIISLQTKINEKRDAYERFVKKLETENPQYHQIKYDVRLLSIDETRKLITDDQAVISFFVGEKHTYIFKITKNDFDVKELNISSADMLAKITKLRSNIYDYYLNNIDRTPENHLRTAKDYAQGAHELYQLLIEPLGELPSRLLIVPDGAISYLPFDVLLTELPEDSELFKQHAYLVKKYSISYSYSATLLQEMQQKKHSADLKTFLAFAPKFDADANVTIRGKRYSLSPLASNASEITQIRDLLRTGTIFVGDEAKEERFKELASQYRIIHFATHGLANNDYPDYSLLAFSPILDTIENELLYVSDLYNMQLNADLVVLSACETGIGKMARGEGIISLARGFSYAGAKSIFTTLWSVNDNATATMVVLFYENIQKGQPKDIALQNAKIQFLENATNQSAHPFFWSPYIIIGDVVPILGLEKTATWLFWTLTIAAIVLAGALLAILRFRFGKK
jgi:CHAT domain-containing protein/tetratricopeptide (TPR) repeat protein